MEDDGDEKTEAPSQRKRDEARQQGQVTFSPDLNAGLLLLAGVFVVWLNGGDLAGSMYRFFMTSFTGVLPHCTDYGPLAALRVFASTMLAILQVAGLLWGLMFTAGLSVSVAQAGLIFSPQALEPKWNKLNPIEGLQRVFSLQGLVKGGTAVAKVVVIAGVVIYMLWGQGPRIASLSEGSLAHSVAQVWDIAIRLMLAIAAALLIIGVSDYAFQRYRFERSLMMTRQELKEESKSEEGDPQIKGRRRQIARQMATRERMMQEVPSSTVVVTNPTHLAIALRYERDSMDAPIVLAKGRGVLAERIVEIARRHNVPIVQRIPVAQALYKSVKPGEEIPAAIYVAVSEVIAYVFQLKGKV